MFVMFICVYQISFYFSRAIISTPTNHLSSGVDFILSDCEYIILLMYRQPTVQVHSNRFHCNRFVNRLINIYRSHLMFCYNSCDELCIALDFIYRHFEAIRSSFNCTFSNMYFFIWHSVKLMRFNQNEWDII